MRSQKDIPSELLVYFKVFFGTILRKYNQQIA